ncbi:MAG: autotransporter domain-containing protein [Hyphomicrobiaceae bacterium]|nr:autotransporter domain-containing protein [Hyphomicrobiaceae bacterium]
MKARFLGAVALGVLSLAATSTAQAQFSTIITFGDSLSDNGNLSAATMGTQPPAAFYPEGVFTNGSVWTDVLATSLGLSGPNVLNFAFGGARTDTLIDPLPPGLPTQIGTLYGQPFQADQLVTIWAGANDFLQLVNPNQAQLQATGIQAATNVLTNASTVGLTGAGTVVIMTLPNLGATPLNNGNPITQQGGFFSSQVYNTALAAGIGAVRAADPDTTYILVDVNPLFNEAIANPATFGLTNVTASCLAALVCPNGTQADEDGFLFYDTVHPTAAVHRIIAGLVLDHLIAGETAGGAQGLGLSVTAARFADVSQTLSRVGALWRAGFDGEVSTNGPGAAAPLRAPGPYFEVSGRYSDNDGTASTGAYTDLGVSGRFGFDMPFGESLIVGAALSASYGVIDGARYDYEPIGVAFDVYATARFGNAFLAATVGAGHSILTEIERSTTIAGVTNTGETTADALSGAVQIGYRATRGAWTFVPAFDLRATRVTVDGYTESGIGAVVTYNDRTATTVTGGAELRVERSYVTETGRRGTLHGLIRYEDTLLSNEDAVTGSIAGANTFTTVVEDATARGFVFGVGLDTELSGGTLVSLAYTGGIDGDGNTSHDLTGRATIRY